MVVFANGCVVSILSANFANSVRNPASFAVFAIMIIF